MPGRLLYFEIGGRAEGIRAMLAHASFEYEDARQSIEQFTKLKGEGALPLGSMPVWEEDGYTTCQSNTILRMLAIKIGTHYYADDPLQCF